jgi:hypothetical protein
MKAIGASSHHSILTFNITNSFATRDKSEPSTSVIDTKAIVLLSIGPTVPRNTETEGNPES